MLQDYIELLRSAIDNLTNIGQPSFSIGNYLEAVFYEVCLLLLLLVHVFVLVLVVVTPVFMMKGSKWLLRKHPYIIRLNAVREYNRDSDVFWQVYDLNKNNKSIDHSLIIKCFEFFDKYNIKLDMADSDKKNVKTILNQVNLLPFILQFYDVKRAPACINNSCSYADVVKMEKNYHMKLIAICSITLVLYVLLIVPLIISFF